MKTLFTFLLFVLPITIGAQTFKTATEYNDYIVGLQNRIGEKMISFNTEVSSVGATFESVNVELKALVEETEKVIKEIEKLPAFEKNTSLRNAAKDLFLFYEKTIKEDYTKMINLIYNTDLTEEDLAQLQAILDKVTNDEKVIDERFQSEQQQFAAKYGFTLEENELQEQLDPEE
ncbi:MAG: hypothetical protein IT221_15015 [Fluviicola sp.]|nr:hypothetical protein [Fluviicola sp.]